MAACSFHFDMQTIPTCCHQIFLQWVILRRSSQCQWLLLLFSYFALACSVLHNSAAGSSQQVVGDRTIEYPQLEGTHKDNESPTHTVPRVTPRAWGCFAQMLLEVCQAWCCYHFPGEPVPRLNWTFNKCLKYHIKKKESSTLRHHWDKWHWKPIRLAKVKKRGTRQCNFINTPTMAVLYFPLLFLFFLSLRKEGFFPLSSVNYSGSRLRDMLEEPKQYANSHGSSRALHSYGVESTIWNGCHLTGRRKKCCQHEGKGQMLNSIAGALTTSTVWGLTFSFLG